MDILEYIQEHELNTSSRAREVLYKRIYAFVYMYRELGVDYKDALANLGRDRTMKCKYLYDFQRYVENSDELFFDICEEMFTLFPIQDEKVILKLIIPRQFMSKLNKIRRIEGYDSIEELLIEKIKS